MISRSDSRCVQGPGDIATLFFVLPETFDPDDFLPLRLRSRGDDARYLVSTILTKFARRDVDEYGFVRLKADYLANVMNRSTYADVVDALCLGKATERFPYIVGVCSFGFVLGKRFVADKHVRVEATDSALIRRLEKFNRQAAAERYARMLPVHRALEERQKRLEIYGRDARRILGALPPKCNPFDVQGLQIAEIEDRRFHHCNVGRTGRFSNCITSMKRELRSCLHVNGEPLAGVDLSCAQPALLAKMMTDETRVAIWTPETTAQGSFVDGLSEGCVSSGCPTYLSSVPPLAASNSVCAALEEKSSAFGGRGREEGRKSEQSNYDYGLRQFVSLVQSGKFYDFMVEQLQVDGISRDEFKHRFLADVIAKKRRYPSVVEDKFKELFASVWEFIRGVNQGDHANLIRRLQREESKFVIEMVAADFIERNPTAFIITLHDAIFTTRRNLQALEQSFHRGFDLTGFPMRLKVEG